MPRKEISRIETEEAPSAIGPYSQAVLAGDFLFISGQIPINPETGEVIKGNIKEQTLLVIENIEKILLSCSLGLKDVVKSEVFVKDMDDFASVNEVYSSKFTDKIKPARHVVEVSRLPKDVDIEISCTAYKGA